MAGTVAKNDSVAHNSSEDDICARTCWATQCCFEVNAEQLYGFSLSAGSRAAFDGLLGDGQDRFGDHEGAMCRRSSRSVIHDFQNSNFPKEFTIARPIDCYIVELFRDSVSINPQLPGLLKSDIFDELSVSEKNSASCQ